MASPVIEVSELTRTYRSGGLFSRSRKEVHAVRGISFEVGRGELFGLLGPNGAGKTTTIKMLMTLLLPTSGSRIGKLITREPTLEDAYVELVAAA